LEGRDAHPAGERPGCDRGGRPTATLPVILALLLAAAVQGQPEDRVVVYAAEYRFGVLALKGTAAVGLAAADVAIQLGTRRYSWPALGWPRWVLWAYRAGEVVFFGAIDYVNSRGGLR